jgi:DNA polymerase-3 subunit gamma/tau
MLSTAAFNALLKTLEEPPPRVVFVLATTDPQRVLPTILSRCQRFDFRRIPMEALERHLAWIAAEEGIGISPEALQVVAQRAQGGLRDAESLLDQLSLLPPPIEPQAVWELLGAVPEQELLELARAMAEAEPLGVVETSRALLERGREPGAVLQGLASLLRDLLLAGVAPDRLELTSVSPQIRADLPPLARRIGKARLLGWQAQLKGSEQQLRHSVQPRLWLEVLLLGLLADAATAPANQAAPSSRAPSSRTAGSGAPPPAATAPAAPPAPAPAAAPAPQPAVATPVAPAASPPPVTPPAAPQPVAATVPGAVPGAAGGADLQELWQQILAGLELPSTRMLLSQQAHLHRLDERRAVVRVTGNWIPMVQGRLPLLEQAMAVALGGPRQVSLEASEGHAAPAPAAPPTAPPAATTPLAAAATPPATPAPPANQPPEPQPTPPPFPTPQAADCPPTDPQATGHNADQPSPALAAPNPAPGPAAAPAPPSRLEEKARLFADFFNGEVISLDESESSASG